MVVEVEVEVEVTGEGGEKRITQKGRTPEIGFPTVMTGVSTSCRGTGREFWGTHLKITPCVVKCHVCTRGYRHRGRLSH